MTVFINPSDLPEHDPTKVRRTKDGRPYVKQPCPAAQPGERLSWAKQAADRCIDGKVPGKRKGTTKQCPKCKGKGYVETIYTRCTSFVGVLGDRTALEKWKLRTVLVGVGVDHSLLAALDAADPDDRDRLDQLADQAFEIGDGHLKARKGTDLHKLSEYVDSGRPLPDALYDDEIEQWRPVTLQDRADMAAWQRIVEKHGFVFVGYENFVVNDRYQIGGTYDRKVYIRAYQHPCEKCWEDELHVILDLKTGRVDYGAGKIAQQLAVYANSDDYDPETGKRSPQEICKHYGLVVHLPQGTGDASVMVVDLVEGWRDVALSDQVREYRRVERRRMWPIEEHSQHVT